MSDTICQCRIEVGPSSSGDAGVTDADTVAVNGDYLVGAKGSGQAARHRRRRVVANATIGDCSCHGRDVVDNGRDGDHLRWRGYVGDRFGGHTADIAGGVKDARADGPAAGMGVSIHGSPASARDLRTDPRYATVKRQLQNLACCQRRAQGARHGATGTAVGGNKVARRAAVAGHGNNRHALRWHACVNRHAVAGRDGTTASREGIFNHGRIGIGDTICQCGIEIGPCGPGDAGVTPANTVAINGEHLVGGKGGRQTACHFRGGVVRKATIGHISRHGRDIIGNRRNGDRLRWRGHIGDQLGGRTADVAGGVKDARCDGPVARMRACVNGRPARARDLRADPREATVE